MVFGDELFDIGQVGVGGQLKHGVDGYAASVDGCHAGGGYHYETFVAGGCDMAQEGVLAGARLAGDEERDASVFNKLFCQLQLWVPFHGAVLCEFCYLRIYFPRILTNYGEF